MDHLTVGGRSFRLTRAEADDVAGIVGLLRDDRLGATREGADRSVCDEAFAAIDADPRQLLVCVRDDAGSLVATMQLTLVPGLSRGGATRLQIEAVRVADGARGSGLGGAMIAWAHEHGRRQGARIAQLTTDKSRTDAHRFYERLGYTATHEGFKRDL